MSLEFMIFEINILFFILGSFPQDFVLPTFFLMIEISSHIFFNYHHFYQSRAAILNPTLY